MKKILTKNLLWLALAALIIALVMSNINFESAKKMDISEFVAKIKAGEITGVEVKGQELIATFQDQSTAEIYKESGESFSEMLKNYDVPAERLAAINVKVSEPQSDWLALLLPSLLPLIIFGVIIYFFFRQVQGQNAKAISFGESRVRETGKNAKNKITFKDVAGVTEAKDELQEIVEFLKNPKKFVALGAKIPKGVLLMGAPGTGKTLLARAVAGEANVPFFHISGSEFVEMFVGVGAARVRDLFQKAKKNAPCIVFVDEIDAVGRQRGAGLGGSHDEREQTLNQILVEMDGFDPHIGVIVIAATNRPDVLDPALLRPGRFDRRVILDLPDIRDREAILKIHARNKPLEAGIDLRRVAERTPGFSGADLANLLNEAAILTARRNKNKIGLDEVFESIEKVMLGPERRSHILSDRERRVTAYHEAGHALTAEMLPDADPVHKVSIISRGPAAGYTLKLPTEDKYLHTKAEFSADIAVMVAGYLTEKMIFGDVTTGASNDLKQATKLAEQMVKTYAMGSDLRTFGRKDELVFLGRDFHEEKDYSEKTAEKIDKEMAALIEDARGLAEKILTEHKDKLELIVKNLMEKETLEQEEFEALFRDIEVPKKSHQQNKKIKK
ncbi:MAG: ATP-dependent zinc metalloprotease FtsH [Patescibacteria group bacterium]|nr:ATP-dependent zinc metalloprotease FtsH [Patescibacteria group bacterium]